MRASHPPGAISGYCQNDETLCRDCEKIAPYNEHLTRNIVANISETQGQLL